MAKLATRLATIGTGMRMADNTHIEWADATWNPVVGCSAVSTGCTHCYAMKHAWRQQAMGTHHYAGTTRKSGERALWTGAVNLAPDHILRAPMKWRKPKRIFVNAMSDLFHPDIDPVDIDRICSIMAISRQHIFQVLTKRPERIRHNDGSSLRSCLYSPHVWFGTSVESADYIDRIHLLTALPRHDNSVRFLSLEPLLGPLPNLPLDGIDWVIVGGESARAGDYRPMEPAWVRDIRDQCVETGIPFFFKQWGTNNKARAGHLLDGQEWRDFPSTPSPESSLVESRPSLERESK